MFLPLPHLLKAILFFSFVSSSLVIKLVDKDSLVGDGKYHPGSHHQNQHQNQNVEDKLVVSDPEAFHQIITSSKGKGKEKFILLNLIVEDDVILRNLQPDLYVKEDLILKDLKKLLGRENLDHTDQNMYSVHVSTP